MHAVILGMLVRLINGLMVKEFVFVKNSSVDEKLNRKTRILSA